MGELVAYTKEQAREYYYNYTKKGKLKGRKKGTKKKKSSGTVSKAARAQCTAECKAVREKIKAEKKEFMRQYREQVKAAIDALRKEMSARLKRMPKGAARDRLKAQYQERIKAMQELKKKQTQQFNDYFREYKEKAVNDIRAKYGLKPLAPSKPKTNTDTTSNEQKAELSDEQKNSLSSALEEIKKK